MNKILNWIVVCFVLFQSCVPSKRLYFFNDQVPSSEKIDSMLKAAVPRINPGDRISVVVSCPDPLQTAFLNPFSIYNTGNNNSNNVNGAGASGVGYLVDSVGNIEFPLLGRLQVTGMTTKEIGNLIQDKLKTYYKDPYVYVNLQGRITIINGTTGTVVPIINERLTIFEAIAQNNQSNTNTIDPSDRYDRTWVIREENGQRTYAQVDLTKKDIFSSPYYYLRNNDLIYVEQGKFSAITANRNATGIKNILSIVAALTGLFFIIKK